MAPPDFNAGHSAPDPRADAATAKLRADVVPSSVSSGSRGTPVAATGDDAAPSAPTFDVDIETLVTEDDTPVDNMPSEKQQRLLTEPLYSSWAGPGAGRTFLAAANVGVFPEPRNPAIVPDMFLSLDVQANRDMESLWDKAHRSYFVWEFGKPPDLVVEIVSNREGNELGHKMHRYASMGVGYYVIYDPFHRVMRDDLRIHRLQDGHYERQRSPRFPELKLGLTQWEGEFEDVWWSGWLRWTDEHGVLIPTGKEDAERERRRAEQERHRAERLAELLRRSGFDPDQG